MPSNAVEVLPQESEPSPELRLTESNPTPQTPQTTAEVTTVLTPESSVQPAQSEVNTEAAGQPEELEDSWTLATKTDSGNYVVSRGHESKILSQAEYEAFSQPAGSTEQTTESNVNNEQRRRENELYEQWKDTNIDPRVILKLKENLARKLATMGEVDASTQKVLGTYEVSGHLLSEGVPVEANGDFDTEGMKTLHAMSAMMDLPDNVLQRLRAEKFGDEPYSEPEPWHKDLDSFIARMKSENTERLEQENRPVRQKISEGFDIGFERATELIPDKKYLAVAKTAAKYAYYGTRYGFAKIEESVAGTIEYARSDEFSRRRRATLVWIGGMLATAGSGLVGIDRKIASDPDFMKPAEPELKTEEESAPQPTAQEKQETGGDQPPRPFWEIKLPLKPDAGRERFSRMLREAYQRARHPGLARSDDFFHTLTPREERELARAEKQIMARPRLLRRLLGAGMIWYGRQLYSKILNDSEGKDVS